MSILTHKCPHCLTDHIALNVVAVTDIQPWNCAVYLRCPKCMLPSCAHMEAPKESNVLQPNQLQGQPGDLAQYRWQVASFWPVAPGPLIPEHLPHEVERVYLQAERNFPISGNEEAAGTMYRKALDVGLKNIAPSVNGTLKARIATLVQQNLLTPALGEWAEQIRLLGNEAAHEIDQPTRDEVEALRNFSDLVLRYLFTLPAMVTARKAPATGAGP
jgi:Domain of unknown function (DUF4145)